MLDLLREYLQDATTPELTEAIRAAHELFDAFGKEDYEAGFEQVLMMDGDAEDGATTETIVDLTRSLQYQLLEAHGVYLSEDSSLSMNNVFLRALKLLPDYDAPESLLSIVGQNDHANDLFAEIVALVSGKNVDNLAHQITRIDPRLLQQIVTDADRKHAVVLTHDQQVLKQQRVLLYKNFIQFAQIKNLKLTYLLTHGMDVGHDFQVYLNLIGQDFDEMEPLAIAHEMICSAFVSADAWENPRIPITQKIDQFVSSMDKITKVDMFVSDLLLRFNAYAKI